MEGLILKKKQGACVVPVKGHKLPCAISNRFRQNLISCLNLTEDFGLRKP